MTVLVILPPARAARGSGEEILPLPAVDAPPRQAVPMAFDYLAAPDEAQIDELTVDIDQLQSGMRQLEAGMQEVGQNLSVTTVDKNWGVACFGSLNGEMLYATQSPFIPSGIALLLPDFGQDTPTFDVHGKSTALGAALAGPSICGMQTGGMFLTFLYGEQYEQDLYGLYIARAYGELKDHYERYVLGIEGDVVTPLSPGTIDFNAAYGAGNLGFWRSQYRYERYFHLSDASQVTTQFSLSDPIQTSFADVDLSTTGVLASAGWPNIEGRVAYGWGPQNNLYGGRQLRDVEVGCSGIVGELRRSAPPVSENLQVWGLGLDAEIVLTPRSGLRGEVYHGSALGNYGGCIVQIFNGNFEEIRSTGGWAEYYRYWNPCWHSHFGYCADDPLNSTLTAALASKNVNAFANIIWDAAKNLDLGLEVAYWKTDYVPAPALGPLNPGDQEAFVIHTRVRLKF